jgi:hypothetical protein
VKIGNGVILTISWLNADYIKYGDTNMRTCVKIRESKKTSKKLIQQEKIKVIKLVWPVTTETDRIQSQSKVIPQIDLEGVRAILCENQSTGNDLYE